MQEAGNKNATSSVVEAAAGRCGRAAFTLVELLVVVGIIAVLISMLLPALSMVRESGQTTKCLSQLRQIGMAISEYANDHDYCMVPGAYGGIMDEDRPTPGGGVLGRHPGGQQLHFPPRSVMSGSQALSLANFVQAVDTGKPLAMPQRDRS